MTPETVEHPPNRLIRETSPYLLQHARNPVDWHPWGPEALALAKAEDKPIFLSIGYSACHWCHVMERESFESLDIAKLMNDWFINVKVDREERPDLDQIYMTAVQAMNQGHGGWPMSVFLTPDGEPFFGGTYYPPRDSRGMPGFPRVLEGVRRAWVERRSSVREAASQLVEMLKESNSLPDRQSESEIEFHAKWIDRAANQLARMFDPVHGGFGSAPKFPHPMDLKVLLRHYKRTGNSHSLHLVAHTIDKMARGGIYDHLGGGFARYSTDARWLVPHFEKMLYDNALLTGVCLELYQAAGHPDVARVAAQTIDYVLDRMTSPQGGFYSTEDADSEGEEGKYYVWTKAEIVGVLGEAKAKTFCYVYDVNDDGNWEGVNILNQPKPFPQAAKMLGRDEAELRAELAGSRAALLDVRDRRIPPGKDEKVLASWNGLMLGPLAEAAWVLDQPRYLDAARKAAGFLLDSMINADGLLLRSWKDGQAKLNGYLDDYANLIDGLTRLFEATGEARWIENAVTLADVMIREFSDPESGGFFYTGASHEALVARPKETHDNATPAGSAVAAAALLRLGALTGRSDLDEAGRSALRSLAPILAQLPAAAGQTAIALDFALQPPQELAVCAGADPQEFRQGMRLIRQKFQPHLVMAPLPPGSAPSPELARLVPLLQNREAREGRLTAYVCQNFICQAPLVGIDAFETMVS